MSREEIDKIVEEMKENSDRVTLTKEVCGLDFALGVEEYLVGMIIDAFSEADFVQGDGVMSIIMSIPGEILGDLDKKAREENGVPFTVIAQTVMGVMVRKFFMEAIVARSSVYLQNTVNERDLNHLEANSNKLHELVVDAATRGMDEIEKEDPDLARALYNFATMAEIGATNPGIGDHVINHEMEA